MEAPYGKSLSATVSYVRLSQRSVHGLAEVLAGALLPSSEAESELLLQLTDWSGYDPTPLPHTLQALRQTLPNTAFPFGGLGVTFLASEWAALVESCAVVVPQGMSAYLYCTAPAVTAYLWEGEFVELWSEKPAALALVVSALRSMGGVVLSQNDG